MTVRTVADCYPTRMRDRTVMMERSHPTAWPGVAGGPASDAEVASYDRNGYLQIPGLLGSEEVARYWDELGRLTTDPQVKTDRRTVVEKSSAEVRSIFEVHKISDVIAELARDPRVLGRVRQLLGSEVYIHQSRINYMPGFTGNGFYWHSDFETWHAEDGLAAPRTVSLSLALTDNYPFNGGLMVMPGSQHTFVSCTGSTPANHYKESLKEQEVGTPDRDTLRALAHRCGIDQFTGPAGSALLFDANMMHGSGNNITPFPRSNIFIVFNSVDNIPGAPFAAPTQRPGWVASRAHSPLRP